MEERKKRGYIDLLRSCAMYMVIALHCVTGYVGSEDIFATRTWWLCSVINGIGRMGVPIFFMISGLLALSDSRTLDIKSFYKKRFIKILVPFICWDVIYFLLTCLSSGTAPDILLFFRELLRTGSKYHLWYVYQILALYLLAPFIKKIVDSCSRGELLIFLFIVLLQPTVFRFINTVQTAVTISPFLALVEGYVGYFLVGYILGTWEFSRKQKGIIYALGVLGLAVNIFGNYFISSPQQIRVMFTEGYSISHYLCAGALFLLARELNDKLPGRRLWSALAGISYGVYLSHPLFIDAYFKLPTAAFTPAVTVVTQFLFASIATTVFAWLLSKIPVLRRLI